MVKQDKKLSLETNTVNSHPEIDLHENVVIHDDRGLQAIIAVHNSNLGPATGGCRIYPYASIHDALTDVLRLSRGMTYKSAMAGLPLGGGKSVIIANPAEDKSRDLLLAMGDFIESFNGQYIAAEDSGTTVDDIKVMALRTRHVSGIFADEEFGGDPSPVTAYGVFLGIKEAVRYRLGTDLQGIRVAVQGVGNVGHHLVRLLRSAKARVIVADANSTRVGTVVKEFRVACCSPAAILSTEVDVIAPCALGSAINTSNLPQIKAKIIAGAANNQLEHAALGEELFQRGILYAPDYVINSGGIIDIHYQQQGVRDIDVINAHVQKISATLANIFMESDRQQRATNAIADEMGRARFMSSVPRFAAA
ncbi:MAG: amino acid dehydrogenase [Proteobacteria bacterium]|nr:amino acid dehydrogenase [Pseudomonadota bacterium]